MISKDHPSLPENLANNLRNDLEAKNKMLATITESSRRQEAIIAKYRQKDEINQEIAFITEQFVYDKLSEPEKAIAKVKLEAKKAECLVLNNELQSLGEEASASSGEKANVTVHDQESSSSSTEGDSSHHSSETAASSLSPTDNGKEEMTAPLNSDSVEKLLTILDDTDWFDGGDEEISFLKSELENFFRVNPNFPAQWMNNKGSSLLIDIVEQLNYHAFQFLIAELMTNLPELERQVLSKDKRGWNIYQWFVNGLNLKALMTGIANQNDALLLSEINKLADSSPKFKAERKTLLKTANKTESTNLTNVYEVESSAFYEQIHEGLVC